jgi:hypothetical protein
MVIRCENCGQSAVEGDVTCWHCGRRLPVAGRPVADGAAGREKVREQWQRPFSLADAAVYVGMSVLVIVGFFWVLGALGRYPLVQARIGRGLPDEWAYYAGDDLAFTLALPEGWQIWQGEEASQQVTETALYRQALRPFGEQADDLTPRFVALAPPREDGEMTMVAVVAQSDALGRLSAAQAIALAERSELVREAEYRSNFARSGVFLSAELADADPPLRCWQYLTGGEDGRETMLLSVCAPDGRFGVYQETLTRILDNFEALRGE